MKELVEYLYVDESRLDQYIEQIHASPLYEKVPVLKAVFSLTGPKVSTAQNRQARPLNRHEKLKTLSNYLHDHHLVATSRREIYHGGSPEFCLETLSANHYAIPKPRDEKETAFTLWLTPGESHEGLCLLPDYRGPDERLWTPTTYSYLGDLMSIVDSLAVTEDVKKAKGNTIERFHRNPVGWLTRLGAKPLGESRLIETLYRMRAVGLSGSAIGYPIYIAEARSKRHLTGLFQRIAKSRAR